MSESSVIDTNRNTPGGGDEEISQTANEIDEILLNRQFISEAVIKVKEVTMDTDLEQSDFVESVATLGDMIHILDNMHSYKQTEDACEETISELKMEEDKAKSCVKKLSGILQKLIGVVDILKDHM